MKFFKNSNYLKLNAQVSARTFVISFVPMILLVGFGFFFLYQTNLKSLETELIFNHNLLLTREEEFIKKTIENTVNDLRFLVYQNELRELIKQPNLTDKSVRKLKLDLIKEYKIFAEQNQTYDQIRLIDLTGDELIKIYQIGNIYLSEFPENLDNESNRYWFKETLKLSQNEIFISPLDLYMEKEKIYIPLKPTIRFLTPVFDKQGKKKALLVINYLAEDLIKNLNQINSSTGKIFILNEEGFWLQGLKKEDEWGFMYGNGQNKKFHAIFPLAWTDIDEKKQGNIKTTEGLFSFIEININAQNLSYSYPIHYLPNNNLKIVIWVAPEVLQGNQQILFKKYIIFYFLSILILAILSGIIATIQAEKQEIQEELKRSEAKFRQIIDTAEEGICIINTQNMITFANPKLAKMLGFSLTDNIVEKSFLDFVNGEYQNLIISQLKYCSYGQKNTFEIELKSQNKTQLWTIISISPIFNFFGNYTGILAMITDISDRHQSEIELDQAKQIAENASQSKSQFIANISHEFRTPLNGILGYAKLLKNEVNLNEEQKKELDIIHNCGISLLNLINDLLSLSKLEANKINLSPSELNLPKLLSNLIEIAKIKAEAKGIKFNYQPREELPIIIYADEKYLRQILLNLLGNAIKFTNKGEVTFKIDLLNSQVSSNQNSLIPLTVCLRFSIKDTGIGIPQEALKSIFLPFKQLSKKSDQTDGTGLGLTISEKLVNILDSEIKVESIVGKGSTFWFDLEVPVITLSQTNLTLSNNNQEKNQENLIIINNLHSVENTREYHVEKSLLIIPDQETLKLLYDLAKKGLLDDLIEQLQKLRLNEPTLFPFCQQIITLAEQFKIKQIRTLLKQYYEEN